MSADSLNYQSPPLYLDGAATSQPHCNVVEEVARCMREFSANPASPHLLGVEAETTMEHARRRIARLLTVDPRGVYFNSGATEGNNTVIRGVAEEFSNRGNHVVISGIEHPSVYEPCRNLRQRGFEVDIVRPEADGRVSPEAFARAIREETILVSIAAVSGEVGAVQPLMEIGAIIRSMPRPYPIFHVDAVQALGRIPLEIEGLGLDCVTLSAHKIRGPRGVGILYLRPGLHVPPLLRGGGQERGLRSGTENLPGIMGTALAFENLFAAANMWTSHEFRRRLGTGILKAFPDARLNGPSIDCGAECAAPHIVNISFPGIPGEVLVHALEERGIFASTGAACSSRERNHNFTLDNMGVPSAIRESAVRFSWSEIPRPPDAERVIEALRELLPHLGRLTGKGPKGNR